MLFKFKSILQLYEKQICSSLSDELYNVLEEVTKSNSVMTSSSNLLLLNVEDILGFAQIKAGKFVKIVKKFNIKRAIDEIVGI